MSSLNLQFKRDDEITIPIALLASNLSCAEIVTVLTFMAMQQGQETMEALSGRITSEEIKLAAEPLRQKRILIASMKGKTLSIEIDMDAALNS